MVSILLPDSVKLILSRIMMLIYCKLSRCLNFWSYENYEMSHGLWWPKSCNHVIKCLSTGPEVQNHSLDVGQGPGTGFQSYSW